MSFSDVPPPPLPKYFQWEQSGAGLTRRERRIFASRILEELGTIKAEYGFMQKILEDILQKLDAPVQQHSATAASYTPMLGTSWSPIWDPLGGWTSSNSLPCAASQGLPPAIQIDLSKHFSMGSDAMQLASGRWEPLTTTEHGTGQCIDIPCKHAPIEHDSPAISDLGEISTALDALNMKLLEKLCRVNEDSTE